MHFREAEMKDIADMTSVRMSVFENVLNTPGLVTEKDYKEYITIKGKGWVCEIEGKAEGFSIVDLQDNNIWALFVRPEFEKKGIGKKLHDMMVEWYFRQTDKTVWLGTSPGTRAEIFYKKAGWVEAGIVNKGEIKFEMSFENWKKLKEN